VLRTAVAALAALVLAAPAGAGNFFRTPSGNIYCAYFAPQLRCDIKSGLKPLPPKPASCDFDWGAGFKLGATGRAYVSCVSDSVYDPSSKVLTYGSTWRTGTLSCASQQAGLRCRNGAGHGFFMSRAHSYAF